MPKKIYNLTSVVNNFNGGGPYRYTNKEDDRQFRPFEKNLRGFSSLGIKFNTSLIRSMRTPETENDDQQTQSGMYPGSSFAYDIDEFNIYRNLVGQNDYIALFDQQYVIRRKFLRNFALQGEINYVVETIANEAIVLDDENYFAYPDTKAMASRLKDSVGKQIIDDLNASYKRVYSAWKFNEGCDAWQWVKKFLVDGFLCFEIIYKTDEKTNNATDIIGFKEIDPITIQPSVKYDANGNEYKVWIMYKGDPERERELLDTNVIYISWAKNNFISRLSYVENLIRPFNTLRTMENAHSIWNVQNAQKRINVSVPIGGGSEQRGRSRIDEIAAYFKEDISIDESSGELMVNGQPKFQFYKTYFTPVRNGEKVEINEIATEGHDMNTTESLKYYWNRFMIETGLPKDRFSMMLGEQSSNIITDKSTMTKEEYKFSLFIRRLRDIIQELLIKPTWIQFCFKYPQFASNDILKSSFGVKFVDENLFQKEKERTLLEQGANTIQTLAGLKKSDGQSPAFSTKFLFEKFLMLSEDDWKLNEKYLKQEEEDAKKKAAEAQAGGQPAAGGANALGGGAEGGGDLFGGGGEAGGGDLFGGTDITAGAPPTDALEPQGFDTSGQDNVEQNFQAGGEIPSAI